MSSVLRPPWAGLSRNLTTALPVPVPWPSPAMVGFSGTFRAILRLSANPSGFKATTTPLSEWPSLVLPGSLPPHLPTCGFPFRWKRRSPPAGMGSPTMTFGLSISSAG